MDDYAAERVAELKKGTMTYSVSENNEYASRSIEDTVADVRVTQLEFADSLGNLSPDGTVLELWYFQYEMKPTNEAGMQIDVIGGQELTDDGYLNETLDALSHRPALHLRREDRLSDHRHLYRATTGCGTTDAATA